MRILAKSWLIYVSNYRPRKKTLLDLGITVRTCAVSANIFIGYADVILTFNPQTLKRGSGKLCTHVEQWF